MPLISRLHLKIGLVYFVLSLLLMLLGALQQTGALNRDIAALAPVLWHFLVVGWLTQIIMGVSLWMFPRYRRDMPRGRETLAWTTLIGLNVGLILRAIAEPLVGREANPLWRVLLVLSVCLQWIAAWAYVVNIWPRIKERP